MRVRGSHATRRKYGGDKLGEGAQAIAYDVFSETGDSIYSLTLTNNNTKLELFLSNGDVKHITETTHINRFIVSLKEHRNFIAKIIKPAGFFSSHSTRSDFIAELRDNQKVIDSYSQKDAKQYLTLTGIEFEGDDIMGAIFKGDNSIHAIFNIRCIPYYDFNVKKFTIDILKSLAAFKGTHNDIKLDNIVLCSDKYKIIDWGKYSKRDTIRFGTTSTANPIKYYIYSRISRAGNYFFTKTRKGKSWYDISKLTQTSQFKEQYGRIIKEYGEEVSITPRSKMMEKYKDTFDVFSFGMTLMYGIIHFNLDYDKYKPLIETLSSIKKPIDASEALVFAKKFFRKLQE
jgi:hypothetical protein